MTNDRPSSSGLQESETPTELEPEGQTDVVHVSEILPEVLAELKAELERFVGPDKPWSASLSRRLDLAIARLEAARERMN